MRLDEYLEREKISDIDFGKAVGVSRQAVHRYKIGERSPKKPVLEKIREVTNGAVTANDFLKEQEAAQ